MQSSSAWIYSRQLWSSLPGREKLQKQSLPSLCSSQTWDVQRVSSSFWWFCLLPDPMLSGSVACTVSTARKKKNSIVQMPFCSSSGLSRNCMDLTSMTSKSFLQNSMQVPRPKVCCQPALTQLSLPYITSSHWSWTGGYGNPSVKSMGIFLKVYVRQWGRFPLGNASGDGEVVQELASE